MIISYFNYQFTVAFTDINSTLLYCTVGNAVCSILQLTSLGTLQHLAQGCDSAEVRQLQAIM